MGLLDQNPFPFHHHDGKELHSILSTLFSPARAQSFCKRVKDFPLTLVDFASNADKVWEEVLDHGSSAGKLRDLAHVILDDREGARVRPLLERLLADPQEDPVVPATGGPLPDAATQAAPPTPVPGAFRMTVIRTLPGHAGWITCLAFSPDRRWLASADVHGTVLLWNLTDDNAAAVPLHGYQGTVYSVAFNNDSSRLATGGADHSIRLWDIGAPGAFTPGIAQKLPEPADSAPVLSVAFNDDGTLLASAEASGTVRLWQLMAPGTPNRVIWRHADQASRIVFSGSGKLLASAGADCSVRLWKAPFVGQPQVLNGHPGRVSGIAFSPDGEQIISADWAKHSLRKWNSATGKETDAIACGPCTCGHEDWVPDIAFSPSGVLASAGYCDGSIRLWDIATGALLSQLKEHRGPVSALAFSSDGLWLASGGGRDRLVRTWSA